MTTMLPPPPYHHHHDHVTIISSIIIDMPPPPPPPQPPPPLPQPPPSLPSCHHYHKKIFTKKYFSSQTLKNILHKINNHQNLSGLTEINKNNIILF
jgi:hypothetical protein